VIVLGGCAVLRAARSSHLELLELAEGEIADLFQLVLLQLERIETRKCSKSDRRDSDKKVNTEMCKMLWSYRLAKARKALQLYSRLSLYLDVDTGSSLNAVLYER
jgi:hypothetical protein